MVDVAEVARKLKSLREEAGLSMREVSESLGWAITRYQHYEDRYRRRFLPIELARHLAALFATRNIDQKRTLELAGLGPQGQIQVPPALAQFNPASVPVSPRDLPIMGAVRGGADGFYFNEGEPKEYVVRPANLAGSSNAFALFVDGDSMEPRYFAGEVLYVNPNRPLSRNCFVAVEMKDGTGMIKQFLRRTENQIVLAQFNPAKEIYLEQSHVKHIYRIVGAGESN